MQQVLDQAWSAPKSAGGEPRGPVRAVRTGQVREAIGGNQGATLQLSRAVYRASGANEGDWMRIMHPRRGTTEWFIRNIDDASGIGRDDVTLTGATLRQLLSLRGTVRTVNTSGEPTTAFTPGVQRVDTLLTRYFAPNLAADGLGFISVRNVEYPGEIDIGTLSQITRGELLDRIERGTGYECDFALLTDDDGIETGYGLDVLRERGSTRAVPILEVGKNLASLKRTRDLTAGATVVEPRSGTGAPMGEIAAEVGTITGTGPWWVVLLDPNDGPAIVREDGQFAGLYLTPDDGEPRLILDSRESDSAVQVSDLTGLSAGALAAFWATASGALPSTVSSPSGLASSRGIVQAPVTVAVGSTARNRAVDPVLANGLALWQRYGAFESDLFDRNDTTTDAGTASASVLSAATAIPVTGFPANRLVRRGDPLFVTGTAATTNAPTVASSAGLATVPIAGTLPATIPGDTALVWTRDGVTIGSVLTDGSQSAGAATLALKSLPSTVALAISDTLTVTYAGEAQVVFRSITDIGGGSHTATFNPIFLDIPLGATLFVTERQAYDGPFGRRLDRVISYEATVDVAAPAGTGTLQFTAADRNTSLYAFAGGSSSYSDPGLTSNTYTLTSAPAWSTGRVSTPAIIPDIVLPLDPTQHAFVWKRGTTVLGFLAINAATPGGSGSVALFGGSNVSLVPNGDVFSLPSFVSYADSAVVLDGAGAGSIPTLSPTPAAIANGTAITIRRCPDYKASEMGSDAVLRLRGTWAGGALTGADYKVNGIFSPTFRVRVPSGASSIDVRAAIGFTSWAVEAAQTYRLTIGIWDADTGLLITNQGGGSTAHAYDTTLATVAHVTLATSVAAATLTRTTRIKVSLHVRGGLAAISPGGFLFARWLSIATGTDLPPLVAGSGSMPLFHRAQDLLAQRASTARYVAQLAATTRYADRDAEQLYVGGSARLRDTALGIDAIVRMPGINWSLTDANDIQLELAVKQPRLTDEGFQEILNA